MAELVANCPRCGAQSITFDVTALNFLRKDVHSGDKFYEAFGVCRQCFKGTTFVIYGEELEEPIERLTGRTLNQHVQVHGFINIKDQATVAPPEHVPPDIANVFREAATCLRVECWNAAGTMFRLCVDLATRPMLPNEDVEGLNAKTKRDLGLRLPWLFANNKLPASLRDLSKGIREDGNDGAHQGTLTKEDAEDLLDFTVALLERIYTEPKKLELAEQRREQRRASSPKK
jgi:Domain of unknown function (DUF4145)